MKRGMYLLPIMMLVAQAGAFTREGEIQQQKGPEAFAITLFTSPARVTAGRIDIRILLENRHGLESVLDAEVSLLLRAERPGAQIETRATRQQAGNQVLYSAPATLDVPGKWQVTATVLAGGKRTEAAAVIDVAPTAMMVASFWGYAALTPLMIAVFAVNGWLMRRKD